MTPPTKHHNSIMVSFNFMLAGILALGAVSPSSAIDHEDWHIDFSRYRSASQQESLCEERIGHRVLAAGSRPGQACTTFGRRRQLQPAFDSFIYRWHRHNPLLIPDRVSFEADRFGNCTIRAFAEADCQGEVLAMVSSAQEDEKSGCVAVKSSGAYSVDVTCSRSGGHASSQGGEQ